MDGLCVFGSGKYCAVLHFHGSGATNSPPVVSCFFSMAMEEQFLEMLRRTQNLEAPVEEARIQIRGTAARATVV